MPGAPTWRPMPWRATAQVINAMGMIPEGVQIWGRETAESLKAHVTAQDRNTYLAGVSKMVRLSTQVAILGWGAWLALHDELTGGMVIAASIVASRALAPLEGTIEGWRGFVHARSAYARIKSLAAELAVEFGAPAAAQSGRAAHGRAHFVCAAAE